MILFYLVTGIVIILATGGRDLDRTNQIAPFSVVNRVRLGDCADAARGIYCSP
jgi:hypothetical protein